MKKINSPWLLHVIIGLQHFCISESSNILLPDWIILHALDLSWTFLFGRLGKDARNEHQMNCDISLLLSPTSWSILWNHVSPFKHLKDKHPKLWHFCIIGICPTHFISPDSAWIPPGPRVPIPTTNYPAPVLLPWAVVATHVATGATCHNQFVWQPTTKANPQRRMVFFQKFQGELTTTW